MQRLLIFEVRELWNRREFLTDALRIAGNIGILRPGNGQFSDGGGAEAEDLAYQVSRVKGEPGARELLRQLLPQLRFQISQPERAVLLQTHIDDCLLWTACPQEDRR